MAKKTLYKVELLPSISLGAQRTMWRAGRQFESKVPQELELTKAEAEAFKNDKRFTISEADGSTSESNSEETSSESDRDSQDTGNEDENTGSDEGSSDEDSDSSEEEDSSDEDTEDPAQARVDDLLANNDRKELNALATDLGIENPDRKEWNKTEVAQAIVEAEASNSESEATS